MDAFNFSTSSLDKSSIASMLRRHQRADAAGSGLLTSPGGPDGQGGGEGGAGDGVGFNHAQTKVQELLNISNRPSWASVNPLTKPPKAAPVHKRKPRTLEGK